MKESTVEKSDLQVEKTIDENEVKTKEVTPTVPVTDENKDLESFITDSTKTEKQVEHEEKHNQLTITKPESDEMSFEDAGELAITGLYGVAELVGKKTKGEIVLHDKVVMLFAALVSPVLVKHGKKIKRLMNNHKDVDMNSRIPELMAFGGVALGGGAIYFAARDNLARYKEKQQKEVKANGDKSKQRA